MQQAAKPRILTNMAFWQSPDWVAATDSIYDLRGRDADPEFVSARSEALALWKRCKDYDVVLTMGARASLAYAWLCLLTGRQSKQVMTEVFIDAPREGDPSWSLKRAAYRAAARRAIGILTNASSEIDAIGRRFALPADRLRYVPLNTNISRPERSPLDEGFILAAGRTLRDYETLARAAREITRPIVVICGPDDLRGPDLPSNIQILREVSRDAYLDKLRRCSLVVLPLLPTERATGQVVLLEAMALGKPVVATRAPGIVDHIEHGTDGLLVDPGDAKTLAAAVNDLLNHPDRARAMSDVALERVKKKFSIERHTHLKLMAIEDLWRTRR